MHYLYRITNLLNNKVYIGQTADVPKRWYDHKSAAKKNRPKQIVHHALIKYGIDNFIFEVIATCLTQADANATEELLIKQHESHISIGKGYNVSIGGMTSPKTDEFKKYLSDKFKGKCFSPSTQFKKGHPGIDSNSIFTDQQIKEIREEFPNISITELAKKYNCGTSTIQRKTKDIPKINVGQFKSGQSSWNKGLPKEQQPGFGHKISDKEIIAIKARTRQFIPEQINDIKQKYQEGLQLNPKQRSKVGLSLNQLGKLYNCSGATIWNIIKNKTYK